MTNKPMLSVERDLLAVIEVFISSQADAFPLISIPRGLRSDGLDQVSKELRALLDKPAYPDRLCHTDKGTHPYICGCFKGDDEAQRRFDERHSKAAQHQVEPVPFAWFRFDDDQKAIFTRSKRTKDSEALYVHPTAYRLPRAEQPAPVAAVPPELTAELRWIFGLMCFQCITYAQALRGMGHTIANKAEDEQAATIHWLYGHYLRDPDNWRTNAIAEIKAAKLAAEQQ